MNLFNTGLLYGLLLSINDLFSMSIIKQITIGNIASNWLIITFVLYGCQMILFYNGLKTTSMSTLNLSWNLFSNIIITAVGIIYFKENLTNTEMYGIGFGLLSLFLFGYSQFNK